MKTTIKIALITLLIFAMLTPTIALAYNTDEPEPYCDYYDCVVRSRWTLWEAFGFNTVDEFMENFIQWHDRADLVPGVTFWRIWGSPSPEAFMEWNDVDEHELAILEEAWAQTLSSVLLEFEQIRNRELQAHGGTPNIINVMINGEFMQFENAIPEIVNGMTFVPATAFLESIGWGLRFNEQTGELLAISDDKSIRMVIGEDRAAVTTAGETRNLSIEAAPFIRNGVSYIPVRPIGEIMGLHVLWDREFGAVVIVDRARLIAEIDQHFTIINSLFNMPINIFPTQDGTFRSVLDILLTLTQFNSIDGDMSTEVDANVTILSDGQNFSLVGTSDLSGLIEYMLEQYISFGFDDDEIALIKEELNILNNISGELIFNYDQGVLYISSPLLGEFFPLFPSYAWMSINELDGLAFGDVFNELGIFSVPSEITISSILDFDSIGNNIVPAPWSFGRFGRITQHAQLMQDVSFYKAILGDERFTVNDDAYTLTITFEELQAAGVKYNYRLGLSDFNLNLTVEIKDDIINEITGELRYRETTPWYDTLYRFEFDISHERAQISGEIHDRNTQRILFDIDLTTTPEDLPVPGSPPAGATIITIEELLGFPEDAIRPRSDLIVPQRRSV